MVSRVLMLAASAFGMGVSGVAVPASGHPGTAPMRTPADGRAVPTASSPLPIDPEVRETLAALSEAVARAERIESALGALERSVQRTSHPDALRLAFQAYFNYRASNPEQVRKPYLYFVDYGLDSSTPRGYVFDMDNLGVVDGPFTVAHGRGSSDRQSGIPTLFSNVPGSYATSLGLYLAQETYLFNGKAGGGAYQSIGLRLHGVSGHFNSMARDRRVVVHGAPYVTPLSAGRSEGCPAMEESRAQRLIPQIANGGLVYLFSPEDRTWLQREPWAHRSLADLAATL